MNLTLTALVFLALGFFLGHRYNERLWRKNLPRILNLLLKKMADMMEEKVQDEQDNLSENGHIASEGHEDDYATSDTHQRV